MNPPQTSMMIKVITLTGDELELEVEPTDTIESIKQKLQELEGIPIDQQRLIYQGRKMRDELSLADFKAFPGMVVHLVIALRGGLRYAEQESHRCFYTKFIGNKFSAPR